MARNTDTAREQPSSRSDRATATAAGLAAAGAGLGGAELVAAAVRPEAAPVVAVAAAVVDATPTPIKELAVATFGTYDKPLLLGGVVTVLVGIAVLTAIAAWRRPRLGFLVAGVLGLLGATCAALRPDAGLLDVLPSLLGAATAGAVYRLLSRIAARAAAAGTSTPTPPLPMERRWFLLATGATVVAAAAAAGGGRAIQGYRFRAAASRAAVRLPRPARPARPLPSTADLRVPGLSPFVTPNRDFYRIDTALVIPQVPAESWQLRIHGMVERPLTVDFRQLLARPLIEVDATLTCVSNEVGGRYVGNARWLGVALADLLRDAGIHRGADQIVARSADGMTIGTPLEAVLDGRDAILAVAMNGEPLPLAHGFPARMLVPGLYGYVSACKWMVEAELTTFASYDAYWVRRGWAEQAPIKTGSRIDTPKPGARLRAGEVTIAGVAWAQHRGISRVEVQVDDAPWRDAALADVPGIDTWRQWRHTWDATPGRHRLRVRATDGDGRTQTAAAADPLPDGASGWHSVTVRVT